MATHKIRCDCIGFLIPVVLRSKGHLRWRPLADSGVQIRSRAASKQGSWSDPGSSGVEWVRMARANSPMGRWLPGWRL